MILSEFSLPNHMYVTITMISTTNTIITLNLKEKKRKKTEIRIEEKLNKKILVDCRKIKSFILRTFAEIGQKWSTFLKINYRNSIENMNPSK